MTDFSLTPADIAALRMLLARVPLVDVAAKVLADHRVEPWKSGSGPGYGWTCGCETNRPDAQNYRPGCGATSPRSRDGEYRHGFYDTAGEASEAGRRHLAEAISVAQVAAVLELAGALPPVDQTPVIRRAIADPAKYTERTRSTSPDCTWEQCTCESLPAWQARAVVIALGGPR